MPRSQRNSVDTDARVEVLQAYSTPTPACKCCGMTTVEFLNVVPIQLGPDGKQIMRPQYAPTAPSRWEFLQRTEFPIGYAVYCSNCVASHQIGDCPYAP